MGLRRGLGRPGAGGNWQAIAKATSCQDNAWDHRCPEANPNSHADSLSMPFGTISPVIAFLVSVLFPSPVKNREVFGFLKPSKKCLKGICLCFTRSVL